MKTLSLACAFALLAAPALAAGWDAYTESDDLGEYIFAYQASSDGKYELEFFCDDLFTDDIAITLYTPADFTPAYEDRTFSDLVVSVGNVSIGPLEGKYIDLGGLVGAQVWEYGDARVRRIAQEAMVATGEIRLAGAGHDVVFSSEGVGEALKTLLKFCVH